MEKKRGARSDLPANGFANRRWQAGGRGARGEKSSSKDRGVSIPVSVVGKVRGARSEERDTDLQTCRLIDLHSFSDHRQVQSLGPIFASRPTAFKDSMMREIVPVTRVNSAKIQFPAVQEIKNSLGGHLCESCAQKGEYEIPDSIRQNFSDDVVELILPSSWIRSAKLCSGSVSCPAVSSISHLSISPHSQIHGLRHAYAHIGGWSFLDEDDRLRVAHAVQERLSSPDRIRFAHVERLTHSVDLIQEYWAELLAFALSIPAEHEVGWRRAFLARAVQRSAGSPLAYPMPETGEKDLQLVQWYFDQTDIQDPWVFGTQANEWIRQSEQDRRALRIKHSISGFPPGKIRMLFSTFVDADHVMPDVAHRLSHLEKEIPAHLVVWVERACVFADRVGSLDGEADESSLFAESAVLASGLERFSEVDQRCALRFVQEYIHQKVHTL